MHCQVSQDRMATGDSDSTSASAVSSHRGTHLALMYAHVLRAKTPGYQHCCNFRGAKRFFNGDSFCGRGGGAVGGGGCGET